ncbi:MAG TPA: neocarzinostatin apoprotein domain-containing protein [Acidimicrobiales bacterium]
MTHRAGAERRLGVRRMVLAVTILAAGVHATPPTAATPLDVPVGVGVRASIAGGETHTCALTSAGGAKCWGRNDHVQLGNNHVPDGSSLPIEVLGLPPDVKNLDAGSNHTCVVTSAGAALCWGDGSRGQIGDGTVGAQPVPSGVVGLGTGVRAVSAGTLHSCALLLGGAVKCWGANDRGQLGDGTTTDRPTPVDVAGLGSGVRAISAGNGYTCAVTASRGAVCWGANQVGQLGDGTTADRLTPAPVSGLTGVSMVDTGMGSSSFAGDTAPHTCAVSLAGTVTCWGNNSSGQLGDGTAVSRPVPTAVTGLPARVLTVAAGARHTCALTSSGEVWCWGDGLLAQTGDGSLTSHFHPTRVPGLDPQAELAAGAFHTCVLDRRGALMCWGTNVFGQVGDGLTEQFRTTPIAVSGSFHRPECPALIPARHTTFTLTNGYAIGTRATFAATSGYALTGPADLRCQPNATWDGTAPGSLTTGTVTASPDTGLVDGQAVSVTLTGWPALGTVPWCQGIQHTPAGIGDCGNSRLNFAGPDETGTAVTGLLVTRVMFVPTLGRTVDCAVEPICVIAATDLQDIPGSVRYAPISFAPP